MLSSTTANGTRRIADSIRRIHFLQAASKSRNSIFFIGLIGSDLSGCAQAMLRACTADLGKVPRLPFEETLLPVRVEPFKALALILRLSSSEESIQCSSETDRDTLSNVQGNKEGSSENEVKFHFSSARDCIARKIHSVLVFRIILLFFLFVLHAMRRWIFSDR